jgi:uncharacterized protein
MRRQEKQITDPATLYSILQSAQVCRLGLYDGAEPYVVPLCFGFAEDTLYFHCADTGRKVSILQRHPRLCFELDTQVAIRQGESACSWGMQFQSIIGYGTARFIEEAEEKQNALATIALHYGCANTHFSSSALAATTVFAVTIERLSGKQSAMSPHSEPQTTE